MFRILGNTQRTYFNSFGPPVLQSLVLKYYHQFTDHTVSCTLAQNTLPHSLNPIGTPNQYDLLIIASLPPPPPPPRHHNNSPLILFTPTIYLANENNNHASIKDDFESLILLYRTN